MTRDLSLRGILSEWVREVVGIEGRLPRTLGNLFAHPGFLTRAALEGERDAYLSALKLFLVVNLAVFFIGPYIGAFAFHLGGFLDERAATSAFFRAFRGTGVAPTGDELGVVSRVATGAVVAALIGLIGWYLSRSLRTVFGLRGVGLWARTALIAAALVVLLSGYSQFLFWSTVVAVRLS